MMKVRCGPISPFDIDHTLPWVGKGGQSVSWSVWLSLNQTRSTRPDRPGKTRPTRRNQTRPDDFAHKINHTHLRKPTSISVEKTRVSRWAETVD